MPDNHYRQTRFLLSAQQMEHFPPDHGGEVAFVGKSNVGKSSVINALTGHSGLARTSKTPGRTQMVNFFEVSDGTRLVDLPGYGFARVPTEVKRHWDIVINDYFNYRQSLRGLILIVDIRRELSDEDNNMLTWCLAREIPVHLLLNKADKLPFGQKKQALLQYKRQLGDRAVSVQLFSATHREGMDELLMYLNKWLYQKNQAPA
jgi:GTP-binding protein